MIEITSPCILVKHFLVTKNSNESDQDTNARGNHTAKFDLRNLSH